METIKQKERPILFSGPMVRAIMEGRKTMTRRVVKPDIANFLEDGWEPKERMYETRDGDIVPAHTLCPYGQPGDRLWVRETFAYFEGDSPNDFETGDGWIYRASVPPEHDDGIRWRSSIYMPRAASRILLDITDVRVERVQEIAEDDAKQEAAEYGYFDVEGKFVQPDEETERLLGECGSYRQGFLHLWQSIHGPASWEQNPWVWVIEFKKIYSFYCENE